MKKNHARLLGLLALLAMLMMAMSVTAAAKDRVITRNLTPGKWTVMLGPVRDEDTGDLTAYLYRIRLKTDGVVRFTAESSVDIVLANAAKDQVIDAVAPGSSVYALSKGTYYVGCSQENESSRIKYTFTKAVNKPNCSMDRAVSLRKGAEVRVCNTMRNSYSRWYKIRLTKKQYLKITAASYQGQNCAVAAVEVRTAAGERVTLDDKDMGYVSSARLKAGTYYIRVSDPDQEAAPDYDAAYLLGWYTTLKWS